MVSPAATPGSAAPGESAPQSVRAFPVTSSADRPQIALFEHLAAHRDVDDVVDLGRVDLTARKAQLASVIVTIENDQADFSPASVVWPPRPRHTETVRRGGGSEIFLSV
jgi:hypothetical protein